MKMVNKGKIIKWISITLVVFFCLVFLYHNATYSSYLSVTSGNVSSNIATFNVLVNGKSITSDSLNSIDIGNIDFKNSSTRDGKVAPGSIGTLNLDINPNNSGVAIRYDIEIIDKNVDNDKVLTLKNISSNNGLLVKTKKDTYTGIFTLDDIKSNKVDDILLSLSWDNDDEVNDLDKRIVNSDNFVEINFTTTQYFGEEIVEYGGE